MDNKWWFSLIFLLKLGNAIIKHRDWWVLFPTLKDTANKGQGLRWFFGHEVCMVYRVAMNQGSRFLRQLPGLDWHVEYVSHTIHRTVVNSSTKFLDEFLLRRIQQTPDLVAQFSYSPTKTQPFGGSAHNEYIFYLAGKNLASALPYWLKVEIAIGLLP